MESPIYTHNLMESQFANRTTVAPRLLRWHTFACPDSVAWHSKGALMQRDYHRWYSHRIGQELGVAVFGHWGSPIIGFPTSAGDEWELEGQGMIGALADFIDAGRIKFYCVNSINGQSF